MSNTRATFGPYVLGKTIGEGEFGKVKLANHKAGSPGQTGGRAPVAIKLIKKSSVNSAAKRTKLMREISILQALSHPYIVTLQEVIETDAYIGMIMEYASGGELFEHILALKYLKEPEACRFFAQLVSAVHYLHSNNYVHRDLKLENLLLDADRNIVITDFGFANRTTGDAEKLMTTSCGSPCYAAPELVISDGYVGESADIWSCGVILFAMLCGYLPFDDDPNNPDGDNINLLYKYILETELIVPDHVSADATHLLKRMLVPDPKHRAKMFEVFRHPWLKAQRQIIDESREFTVFPASFLIIHPQQKALDAKASANGAVPEAFASQNVESMVPVSSDNGVVPMNGILEAQHVNHHAQTDTTRAPEPVPTLDSPKLDEEAADSPILRDVMIVDSPSPPPPIETPIIHVAKEVQNDMGIGGPKSASLKSPVNPIIPMDVLLNHTASASKSEDVEKSAERTVIVAPISPEIFGDSISLIKDEDDDKVIDSANTGDELQTDTEKNIAVDDEKVVDSANTGDELQTDTAIAVDDDKVVDAANTGDELQTDTAEKNIAVDKGSITEDDDKSDTKDQIIEIEEIETHELALEENKHAEGGDDLTPELGPLSPIMEEDEDEGEKESVMAKKAVPMTSPRVTERSLSITELNLPGPSLYAEIMHEVNEGEEVEEVPSVQEAVTTFKLEQKLVNVDDEGQIRHSVSGYRPTAIMASEDPKYRKSFDVWFGKHEKRGSKSKFKDVVNAPTDDLVDTDNVSTGPIASVNTGGKSYTGSRISMSTLNPESRPYKLRYHMGAIDQRALTNRPPLELLADIILMIRENGMYVRQSKSDSTSFKLKIVRPAKKHIASGAESKPDHGTASPIRNPQVSSGSNLHNRSTPSSRTTSSSFVKTLQSFPKSFISQMRYRAKYGTGYNKAFNDSNVVSPEKVQAEVSAASSRTVSELGEMKFYIEIQKIKNLAGLYVVEFKRRQGDIWEFKRLYEELLPMLKLEYANDV